MPLRQPASWLQVRSMSSSTLLAPMRKRFGCSQLSPSSSFTSDTYSSACFAVRMPPAGLNPTDAPVLLR